MKIPNRTKTLTGAAVLSVFLAAVCAVSAAYVVRISADGELISDAVFCIVIAAVSAVCLLAVFFCLYRLGRSAKIAKTPVFYTMVEGPKEGPKEEEKKKPVKIKGKMPPKDH